MKLSGFGSEIDFEIVVDFGIEVGFGYDMGSKHYHSVNLEVNKSTDHFDFGRKYVKNVRLSLCFGIFWSFWVGKRNNFFTIIWLFE